MFHEVVCLGSIRSVPHRTLDRNVLTAASVSAMIFLDFSRSFFSCDVRAISDARSRRFST